MILMDGRGLLYGWGNCFGSFPVLSVYQEGSSLLFLLQTRQFPFRPRWIFVSWVRLFPEVVSFEPVCKSLVTETRQLDIEYKKPDCVPSLDVQGMGL